MLNKELWVALDELVNQHETTWTGPKGHASHEDNNRCDELANAAARDPESGSVQWLQRRGDRRRKGDGERICLFGGTFDPVHNAHLQIAREAISAIRSD